MKALICMAMTTGSPVVLEGNIFKGVLDWTSSGTIVGRTGVFSLDSASVQTHCGLTLQPYSAWDGVHDCCEGR